MRDLDLGGAEVTPVARFAGTFDGQGHTLASFTITRDVFRVGLFATLARGGSVRALRVANARVTGLGTVGVIAGESDGHIADVHVAGEVVATSAVPGGSPLDTHGHAGGIAGVNRGSISGSSSAASVVAGRPRGNAGGIAGRSTGGISDVSASGPVDCHRGCGGLVGAQQSGSLVRGSATGPVSSVEIAGGAIGSLSFLDAPAYISEVHASGAVVVAGETAAYAGGLIGVSWGSRSVVVRSSAHGDVRLDSTGTGGTWGAGGFIGRVHDGFITRAHATGDVVVTGGAVLPRAGVGGFVGFSGNNRIEDCYARGDVSFTVSAGTPTGALGALDAFAGGFVGTQQPSYDEVDIGRLDLGVFARVYASGAVVTTEPIPARGFAGFFNATGYGTAPTSFLRDAYWDAEVSGLAADGGVGAQGLSTAALKTAATFLGWDGAVIWSLVDGAYPTLR